MHKDFKQKRCIPMFHLRCLSKGSTPLRNAYCKYISALLLFGSNGIVASRISLTSYEIVLLRTLAGSLFLLTLFLLTGKSLTFRQHRRQFFFLAVSGAAMGASWMFLYEAYRQIGVSLASLAYYCGPVIVMALSPFLFHEKLTRTKSLGFFIVLCGVGLVNGQAFQEGKTGWGLICGGMSAVLYALMVLCNQKAKDIAGLENAMLQLCTALLTVAAFVSVKQGLALQIAEKDWIPILFLGFLNTGIGCYFYFSSIGQLPVQSVAICGYLEPLSAVLFSVLLLRETMQPLQVLGAILILGGAAFSECTGKTVPRSRCVPKTGRFHFMKGFFS